MWFGIVGLKTKWVLYDVDVEPIFLNSQILKLSSSEVDLVLNR